MPRVKIPGSSLILVNGGMASRALRVAGTPPPDSYVGFDTVCTPTHLSGEVAVGAVSEFVCSSWGSPSGAKITVSPLWGDNVCNSGSTGVSSSYRGSAKSEQGY